MKRLVSHLGGLCLLALFLSACGGAKKINQVSTIPSNLISVNFSINEALATQGVPKTSPTGGDTGLQSIKLRVFKADNTELFFKDQQPVSETEGERVVFPMNATASTTLMLEKGSYKFQALGYAQNNATEADTEDDEPILFAEYISATGGKIFNIEPSAGITNFSVRLTPTSLVGSVVFKDSPAALQALSSLAVAANSMKNIYAAVYVQDQGVDSALPIYAAESDFSLSYIFEQNELAGQVFDPLNNAALSNIFEASDLGVRVGFDCDIVYEAFTVQAIASFKQLVSAAASTNSPWSLSEGSISSQKLTVTPDPACLYPVGVSVDVIPPTLTIGSPDANSSLSLSAFVISGTASDLQTGITKIEIYEGVKLLTTIMPDISLDGSLPLSFEWSYNLVDLGEGIYNLTVIAYDAAPTANTTAKTIENVTIDNSTTQVELTLNVSGSGSITGTSTAGGYISCNSTLSPCTASFDLDDTVILSAMLTDDSIVNWQACDTVTVSNECVVSLSATKSVTATIDLNAPTDITKVEYTNATGNVIGDFSQQIDSTWVETNADGQFFFTETGRDYSGIYLRDACGRNIDIKLDIEANEVLLATTTLYTITEVSSPVPTTQIPLCGFVNSPPVIGTTVFFVDPSAGPVIVSDVSDPNGDALSIIGEYSSPLGLDEGQLEFDPSGVAEPIVSFSYSVSDGIDTTSANITIIQKINLLANPSFEDDDSSATSWQGDSVLIGNSNVLGVSAHEGNNFIYSKTPKHRIFQKINLEDIGVTNALIDAESFTVHFGGWQNGKDSNSDTGQIRVKLLDAEGKNLATKQLGKISEYSEHPEWTELKGSLDVPAGTRSIMYVFIGELTAGGHKNDAYLDAAFLTLGAR